MKNVVSFSLWGSDKFYTQGAIKNAMMYPRFLRGWVCRFYYDSTVPADIVARLDELGAELTLIPGGQPRSIGLYWRFSPMFDDPEVDHFIVRDTDCRPSEHEASAVQEWVESGLPFSSMRDNPQHGTHLLGGGWGACAGSIPDYQRRLSLWFQEYQPPESGGDPRGEYYRSDQFFLSKYIWPEAMRLGVMSHGPDFKMGDSPRPFPVPPQVLTAEQVGHDNVGKEHYVGMIFAAEEPYDVQ